MEKAVAKEIKESKQKEKEEKQAKRVAKFGFYSRLNNSKMCREAC